MKQDSHWYKDNPFQKSNGKNGYFIHDRATRYAMRVIQQDEPAPSKIIKVAERHLDDIDRASMPGANIWWDYGALQKFDKFCSNYCIIPDHRGYQGGGLQPLKLLDCFAFAYGLTLGWKMNNPTENPQIDPLHRRHLSRRYRSLFLEMPKGTGKTPVSAAYLLYHMCGHDLPKASETDPWAFVATDLDKQSNVIKGFLHTMISVPYFREEMEIEYAREIYYCEQTGAKCEFRSAKGFGKGLSGFNPSLIIVEEPQDHSNLDLYENLIMGLKSRIEPLTIFNLNAGHRINCPFWVERQKAGKIADGIVKADDYMPLIWGIDAGDDPLNGTQEEMEKVWRKVHPNLGVTIGKDKLMERVLHAKSSLQRKAEILRLYFGVWTRGISTDWLDFSAIEACFQKKKPVRTDWDKVPTVVALDLSRSASLTGFAQAWYLEDDVIWVEADGYTCNEGIKAILDEAPYLPIEAWLNSGLLQGRRYYWRIATRRKCNRGSCELSPYRATSSQNCTDTEFNRSWYRLIR